MFWWNPTDGVFALACCTSVHRRYKHRSLLIRQLRWAIRQHANDASIWKRIEEEQQKQREKSTVWRCCFVGVYLFVLRKKIKPSNATFLSLCGEKRKKARIHFRKGAIVVDTYDWALYPNVAFVSIIYSWNSTQNRLQEMLYFSYNLLKSAQYIVGSSPPWDRTREIWESCGTIQMKPNCRPPPSDIAQFLQREAWIN